VVEGKELRAGYKANFLLLLPNKNLDDVCSDLKSFFTHNEKIMKTQFLAFCLGLTFLTGVVDSF
jgi:hypothetical protein